MNPLNVSDAIEIEVGQCPAGSEDAVVSAPEKAGASKEEPPVPDWLDWYTNFTDHIAL